MPEVRFPRLRAVLAALPIILLIVFPWTGEDAGKDAGGDRLAESPRMESGVSLPDADWLCTVSSRIEAMEYSVSAAPHGLQAPNRAQDLRFFFSEAGIEVVPRRSEGGAWRWTWETVAFGRVGSPNGVASPELASAGSTVRYLREGWVEWYQNGPAGLEQGYEVENRPPGDGALCVTGRIGGDLTALAAASGEALAFADRSGSEVLRYGKLAAFDASGAPLPCDLQLAANEIRILVDDRDAAYPILIDPLLDSPSWQQDGEQEGEAFGREVSTAGDVNGDGYSDLIIGTPSYDGALVGAGRIWVYHGSPQGLSSEPAWFADGDRAQAALGFVSAAGDVNGDGYGDIIAGAPLRPNDDGTVGAVYIYEGGPDGLSIPAWFATCTQTDPTQFGGEVAGAGDLNGDGYDDIAYGAFRFAQGGSREGRAWVHLGSADGVEDAPVWVSDGGANDCYYGAAICTAGDVNADGYDDLAVSAQRYPSTVVGAGRVFLYLGSPTGPSPDPDWTADGEVIEQRFGLDIAPAGDTDGDGYADLLVSTLYTNPEPLEGRVYLYRGCPGGLEAAPAWQAEGNCDDAYFGYSVATAGDVNGDGLGDVLIGAPFYLIDGEIRGRAFLYFGTRAGLPAEADWTVDGTQAESDFGLPAVTAGDVNGDGFSDIAVAARRYQGTYPAQGRVCVYHGGGNGPRSQAGWVIESNQDSALFGRSLNSAGDVNGDGFDDLLISAPFYDNGEVDEGAIFLFLGHGGGASVIPDWWAEGNQVSAYFGRDAACAGDVNGDGYDDIIVGAPFYDSGFSDEGRAFIWLGTPSGAPPGNPANAFWSVAGMQDGASLGFSVASAGDCDGDGYSEVVVGAIGFTQGQSDEGAIAVYRGSPAGPSPNPNWFIQGNQVEARFGYAVASAGDVDGDGYADLLTGAPYYDSPETNEGIVLLFLGAATGLSTVPAWSAESNQPEARLGWALASAGDVNGDGCSDILVGAPRYTLTTQCGIACMWLGGEGGPIGNDPIHADWMSGTPDGEMMGHSVSSAGDVDGDGYSDVMIGIPEESDPEHGIDACGAVLFLRGGPEGLVEGSARKIYGVQTGAQFGYALGSADLNGDGFPDLLVGAPFHDQGQTDEGRAFVFYGNNSRGLPRAVDQLRPDLSRPVPLGGSSGTPSSIALSAQGRTAAGRAKVWLEWEVKPFRARFDGCGIGTGSTYDTGAPVAGEGSYRLIREVVSGLPSGVGQHWRLRVASSNPYFPRTPWFSHSGNAPTELDFRTTGVADATDPLPPRGVDRSLRIAPNPFVESATIRLDAPGERLLDVTIYDAVGRRIRRWVGETEAGGPQEWVWDGRDDAGRRAAGGIYWLRALTEERSRVAKIVLAN